MATMLVFLEREREGVSIVEASGVFFFFLKTSRFFCYDSKSLFDSQLSLSFSEKSFVLSRARQALCPSAQISTPSPSASRSLRLDKGNSKQSQQPSPRQPILKRRSRRSRKHRPSPPPTPQQLQALQAP